MLMHQSPCRHYPPSPLSYVLLTITSTHIILVLHPFGAHYKPHTCIYNASSALVQAIRAVI